MSPPRHLQEEGGDSWYWQRPLALVLATKLLTNFQGVDPKEFLLLLLNSSEAGIVDVVVADCREAAVVVVDMEAAEEEKECGSLPQAAHHYQPTCCT